MNYPFLACVNNFWADAAQSGTDFMHGINQCYSMYYEQVNRVLFNLLDSHDTDRLMGDVTEMRIRFWHSLRFCLPCRARRAFTTAPRSAWTEAGTKANRECMPWEKSDAGSFAG